MPLGCNLKGLSPIEPLRANSKVRVRTKAFDVVSKVAGELVTVHC